MSRTSAKERVGAPSPRFASCPATLTLLRCSLSSISCRSFAGRVRSMHRTGVFELEYDGFRALAYVDYHGCRLVSRNGHDFASFPDLASSIAQSLEGTAAIFDGEIVCVDHRDGLDSRIFFSAAAKPVSSHSICCTWTASIFATISSLIVRPRCEKF